MKDLNPFVTITAIVSGIIFAMYFLTLIISAKEIVFITPIALFLAILGIFSALFVYLSQKK